MEFSSGDDLATHMKRDHDTADKVVILNRSESIWTACNLVGEELFKVDEKDLIQVESSSPLKLANFHDEVAKVIRVNRQTISFLVEGRELCGDVPLETLNTLIMKQNMLIERSQKMHALEEQLTTKRV